MLVSIDKLDPENRFSCQDFFSISSHLMKFFIVLHEYYLSGCMATKKPEIVITVRWYEIEMQFRRLDIGF